MFKTEKKIFLFYLLKIIKVIIIDYKKCKRSIFLFSETILCFNNDLHGQFIW